MKQCNMSNRCDKVNTCKHAKMHESKPSHPCNDLKSLVFEFVNCKYMGYSGICKTSNK